MLCMVLGSTSRTDTPPDVITAWARRPAQLGNTNESLARYRDEMLLEILKLHHKL